MPSARASASMAARGSMAYSFGGVCDEETEDAIKGQFFNDLFAFVVLACTRLFSVCGVHC